MNWTGALLVAMVVASGCTDSSLHSNCPRQVMLHGALYEMGSEGGIYYYGYDSIPPLNWSLVAENQRPAGVYEDLNATLAGFW